MPQLRNIALTVQELEDGEFHWVLMEAAADSPTDEVLPYVVIETANQPQPTYANALVLGVAALRRAIGGAR